MLKGKKGVGRQESIYCVCDLARCPEEEQNFRSPFPPGINLSFGAINQERKGCSRVITIRLSTGVPFLSLIYFISLSLLLVLAQLQEAETIHFWIEITPNLGCVHHSFLDNQKTPKFIEIKNTTSLFLYFLSLLYSTYFFFPTVFYNFLFQFLSRLQLASFFI